MLPETGTGSIPAKLSQTGDRRINTEIHKETHRSTERRTKAYTHIKKHTQRQTKRQKETGKQRHTHRKIQKQRDADTERPNLHRGRIPLDANRVRASQLGAVAAKSEMT